MTITISISLSHYRGSQTAVSVTPLAAFYKPDHKTWIIIDPLSVLEGKNSSEMIHILMVNVRALFPNVQRHSVSSLYFRSRCDRGFYFSCPLLLVSGDACLWVVVVDVLSFFAIKSKKKYLKMYKMSLNMKSLSWLALVRTPFKTVNTVLIWFKSSSWCSCLNFGCSYCLHLHASVQWVAALWVADWIFR